jgi:hypothetical protein
MTRGREGLTIVETLIAIAVIGVVFVVLAAIQVSNLGVTRAAREDSQLLQDAVTEFEDFGRRPSGLSAYFEGCPDGCASAVRRTQLHGFPYVITRVWPPDDDSGTLVGTIRMGRIPPRRVASSGSPSLAERDRTHDLVWAIRLLPRLDDDADDQRCSECRDEAEDDEDI